MTVNWKMFPDFSRGENNRLMVDKHATYDLASWSIRNCPDCFRFLLDQDTIRASYFCHTGESFYWIACKDNLVEQGARITSLMSYENLLQPFLIDRSGYHSKSIFQSSTWSEPWFRVCWERVKSQPQRALFSLGPMQMGQICRFADPGLAQELLNLGLKIGEAHDGYLSPWKHVLAQKSPEPMFEWLWKIGYRLPDDILEHATKYYCAKAAGWIIRRTNHQDWRQAVLFAAGSMDQKSAGLFELLIQQAQFPLEKNKSFTGDVLIAVVDEVCAHSTDLHHLHHAPIFQYWKDDPSTFYNRISDMQKVAVRKIQALGQLAVAGVGMKVQTEDAGLREVTEALESLDP
jgi:hypothetical protein